MKLLVVAPHPDDEILGCGGTLLKLRKSAEGAELHWLLLTEMRTEWGYAPARIEKRNGQIAQVARRLGVAAVHRLGFRPAGLDAVPLREVIAAIGDVLGSVQPDTLLVPFAHDVHSDHRVAFNAAAACSKSFRHPTLRRLLAYETPSETDFAIDPGTAAFRPNLWVDIGAELDEKLDVLGIYDDEIGAFPHPRSKEAVQALARVRGSAAGVAAAEAFMLLKAIV